MASNETNPNERLTMTQTSDPTIKIEDFGNGIFIKWKIHT